MIETNKNSLLDSTVVWRMSLKLILLIALLAVFLLIPFYESLIYMVDMWGGSEEYGYGYLIPFVVGFFIWQRKDELERIQFEGSWVGVFIVLAGLFLYVVGELSTLYIIIQYSFLITLYGLILALIGWRAFKLIWVPLLLLFFMVPLPNFLYQGLSAQLQLVSSEFGVAFIRLFGISVYLEGNVIDLGNYKLQVVEACSGLRYLFPLAALSFMTAYIYKAAFWKRATIFLSSIPITVIMNSFRIGVIGILVDKWGISQAEGFLHFFEGWIIFMACLAILVLEMWVFTKIGSNRQSLGNAFALEFPEPSPSNANLRIRKIHIKSVVSAVLLILSVAVSASLDQRQEIYPDRVIFSEFPLIIKDWNGNAGRLENIYLDALDLDDYIIANYVNGAGERVELYAAYYASQSKGESAHSPRSCLPGGGWQIKSLSQQTINGVLASGVPLRVNRVVIRSGDYQQIVYYWFQGRSRIITNEYMVKWFLFWDALTRSRTDGALVRLTAFVAPGEDVADVDRRLTTFTKDVSGLLADYIPD